MTAPGAFPERIPVLVIVDVEPDERQPLPGTVVSWQGFDKAWDLLSDLRPRLAAATGTPASFCWYLRMDPQIRVLHGDAEWIVHRHRRRFDTAAELGDEIGVHPHAHRWLPDRRTWRIDHGDEDWVRECIECSLDAYASAFGCPCDSHRFGDRFFSEEVVAILEQRGVRFDLSLEPGRPERARLLSDELNTGAIPDMRRCPRVPYRPARGDWRAGGGPSRSLWMVPLTTVALPGPLAGAARLLRSRFGRGREDPGVLSGSLGHRPRLFDYLLRRALAERPSHLALVLRSGDLGRPAVTLRVRENVERLVSVARRQLLRLTDPAGVVATRG